MMRALPSRISIPIRFNYNNGLLDKHLLLYYFNSNKIQL